MSRDKLFVLADGLQVSSTIRTAVQFRFFRLANLHHFRQFSMSKFPFPRFASWTPRLLHPMPPRKRRRLPLPDPLQILDLFLLLLHHLLQPFDLLLLLLNDLQRLRQLFLQITASARLSCQAIADAACVLCSCPAVYRLSRFTDKSRFACLFPDVRPFSLSCFCTLNKNIQCSQPNSSNDYKKDKPAIPKTTLHRMILELLGNSWQITDRCRCPRELKQERQTRLTTAIEMAWLAAGSSWSTIHHLRKSRFHCRPLRIQDAIKHRMTNASVRQDHMIAQHAFLHGANPFDCFL